MRYGIAATFVKVLGYVVTLVLKVSDSLNGPPRKVAVLRSEFRKESVEEIPPFYPPRMATLHDFEEIQERIMRRCMFK